MKILAIGAHPADCIDLAGGTLAMHVESGDEVVVLTLTDGIYGHTKDMKYFDDGRCKGDKKKILERKLSEFSVATSMIGATCDSFGWVDEPLMITQGNIFAIVDVIRTEKPDIVITHHPNEYSHWDHAECGKAVCRALKSAIKLPSKARYWVPMVYFFAVQFRPEATRLGYLPQAPDLLVDIYDVIEKKMDAMKCFETQGLNDVEYLRNRMNSFESEMGRADGLRYSEGFTFYYPLKTFGLIENRSLSFYNKEDRCGKEKEDI